MVTFSYHSILFQKMEMSSHWEETYFAKKIVRLSFLFEKGFRFQNEKKYLPASPKLSLLLPSHTQKMFEAAVAATDCFGGRLLVPARGEVRCSDCFGVLHVGREGSNPWIALGRCALVAPGEIGGGGWHSDASACAVRSRLALAAGGLPRAVWRQAGADRAGAGCTHSPPTASRRRWRCASG